MALAPTWSAPTSLTARISSSEQTLPAINPIRSRLKLDPFDSLVNMAARPHRMLYYTVKDLDYSRKKWLDHADCNMVRFLKIIQNVTLNT